MMLVSVAIAAHSFYVAGKRLHRILLDKVLRAKMTFFDTKPLGMILNRFSKDIDVIGMLTHYHTKRPMRLSPPVDRVSKWHSAGFSTMSCFFIVDAINFLKLNKRLWRLE